MFFINVILPLNLNKAFTYKVSETEFEFIEVGMRVAVQFGKSKVYTGLVLEKHHQEPLLYEAKEIQEIIDDKPIVTPIQLAHWQWISQYYMCSVGDVYRAALPSSLLLESETVIHQAAKFIENPAELTDDEYLVFEALQQQTTLKIADLIKILGKKNVLPFVQKLLAKNIVVLQEEITETYKPKTIRYIKLHEKYNQNDALEQLLNELKNAPKQKELILQYFQLKAQEKKHISAKKLLENAQLSTAVLKSLVDKNIFEEYFIEHHRMEFSDEKNYQFNLSEAQKTAYNQIIKAWDEKDVCLLHGITGSGKTEIYIKLMETVVQQGKQVLLMLPEIALTTQLVNRLTAYFGNIISVFHSKYSNNERVEVWKKVNENSPNAQIIIGVRSALFLPFQKLGLLIIDEEHEQTYKQTDPAPRYHARDAALVLAHKHQAKVLLGSATPSLETYQNTIIGKYAKVSLTERFGEVYLPEIELIDLKDKHKRKQMKGHFSNTLIAAITETVAKGEQVIIFQNRRGYAPVIECVTCGHIPQCPQCDVSLTYYKHKAQLKCHYCGYAMAKPTHCHKCHSVDLESKGFGTEQVELELQQLFPEKKIARMDQDTTRGKHAFETILDALKNQEIDILVGTQMVAKGLHFEKVTLVGVLNADNLLFYPDFRAMERAFQMLTQVAGRAGRSVAGKVYIQTYNPLQSCLQQVVTNQYEAMFAEQMNDRNLYAYPPYFRIIKITLKHKNYQTLVEGSFWLYNVMKQQLPMPILGPEEPPISRIRNEYIRNILLKIPQQTNLDKVKQTLQKIYNSFEATPNYRSIKVVFNVDFY